MNTCCCKDTKPRVSIIAGIGRNRELGGKNDMLWHIPEDFKHFKKTTMGKPIIMGSATCESIGRALPGRLNIVLSHDEAYKARGCEVVHSLEDAFALATGECPRRLLGQKQDECEIFIIGGGFVYKQALEQGIVDRLYLTIIDADFTEADVFFPEYRETYGFTKAIEERDGKKEIEQKGTESPEQSRDKTFTYKFVTLERDDKTNTD